MGALFALIFVSAPSVWAQRTSRTHDKVHEISDDDARERWLKFASSGIDCDYRMAFKIRHSPRKGESSNHVGEIYGMRFGSEERMRIIIKDPVTSKYGNLVEFLIINSPIKKEIWKFGNKLEKIPESEWGAPILGGLIISPFDLMMPYKNWAAKYDGAGRIGQAVYFYILKPTENETCGIEKIRVALTREFNSPAQVVAYLKDAPNAPAKSLTLGAVKKIDGYWSVLEFDMRNEITRDKDTLRFTAAKMRAEFSSEIFQPENLGRAIKNPPTMDSL